VLGEVWSGGGLLWEAFVAVASWDGLLLGEEWGSSSLLLALE